MRQAWPKLRRWDQALHPAHHCLEREGDGQCDEQEATDQEDGPHDIGHNEAEAMLMTRSIRDGRNQEQQHVSDSENDQGPSPHNDPHKPLD
jgi:hypothetical protein